MVGCVSLVDCGCGSGFWFAGIRLLVYFGYACLCCSACIDLVVLVFGRLLVLLVIWCDFALL